MTQVKAGVYRVDITPPIGISMVGYYSRSGASNGIAQPLTATALVLSTGDTKIAIVACDLVFIQNPAADEIRGRIADAIGASRAGVLINCSHTHCGPTVPGFTFESEEQRSIQGKYFEDLKNKLVGCVRTADSRQRPARIGFDRGSVQIGINRREKDEDGKYVLGEDPDGPMDSDVPVVRIDEEGGRPLAVLFAYGCHTVTMGPKCLQLTPDFPGPARKLIEATTGAMSLFLQGAAGNINPITGIGTKEDDTDNMLRVGNALGAEVVKTMMRIRTHDKRGPRTIFSSLSKNFTYPYVPLEATDSKIAVVDQILELPMLPFPSLEEARQILQARTDILAKAQKDGLAENHQVALYRFRDWAKTLKDKVEAGIRSSSVPLSLQAFRVGDIAFATAAGETLVELGLSVKKASPFPDTIFLGYSNGCIGYIPPAEAYPSQGWSPWRPTQFLTYCSSPISSPWLFLQSVGKRS